MPIPKFQFGLKVYTYVGILLQMCRKINAADKLPVASNEAHIKSCAKTPQESQDPARLK